MTGFPTKFMPLPTEWHGYRFRSRIEARWAVFFDSLNIPFLYEPEGFDLGHLRYQPDFLLPQQHCWFEVKGEYPLDVEHEKAHRLAIVTELDVYIAWGECTPSLGGYSGIEVWIPEGIRNHTQLWCDLGQDGHAIRTAGFPQLAIKDGRLPSCSAFTEPLQRAYRRARQERFGT